jgi:hypothetical protein
MAYKPKKSPKSKFNFDSIIEINNQKINLGKLITVTNSRCSVRKINLQTFTCVNTQKTFTSLDKATKHVAKYLVDSGKVILNN